MTANPDKLAGPPWYQFSLREIFMVALVIGVVAAIWYQSQEIARLNRELNRLLDRSHITGEPLKFSGTVRGSLVRRDGDDKPQFLQADGSRIDVFETFALVYIVDRQSPETVTQMEFIPRDRLLQLWLQPPK